MPTVAPPRAVLVPGLGLGPAAWAPTLTALGWLRPQHLRCSVRPLPGYGLPVRPGDNVTPRALGQTIAAECLEPGGPVVLFGHSASCQVVAHAAASARGRVLALVLVGPTTDPRASGWAALASRWFATAVHEPPWQVPLLAREYRRTGLRSMRRAMDAARRDDIAVTLAEAGAPVLVIRGRHDRIVPADWAERLGGGSPAESTPATPAPVRASVTLSAGGHMVPLTHGPLTAGAVLRFLDRLQPPELVA